MQSADGWREYVARLRLSYCPIRHEVSRMCPANEGEAGQQGLYHFVFGVRDEVVDVEGPAALLRAVPRVVSGRGDLGPPVCSSR